MRIPGKRVRRVRLVRTDRFVVAVEVEAVLKLRGRLLLLLAECGHDVAAGDLATGAHRSLPLIIRHAIHPASGRTVRVAATRTMV